jgi:hypothetical protein
MFDSSTDHLPIELYPTFCNEAIAFKSRGYRTLRSHGFQVQAPIQPIRGNVFYQDATAGILFS